MGRSRLRFRFELEPDRSVLVYRNTGRMPGLPVLLSRILDRDVSVERIDHSSAPRTVQAFRNTGRTSNLRGLVVRILGTYGSIGFDRSSKHLLSIVNDILYQSVEIINLPGN